MTATSRPTRAKQISLTAKQKSIAEQCVFHRPPRVPSEPMCTLTGSRDGHPAPAAGAAAPPASPPAAWRGSPSPARSGVRGTRLSLQGETTLQDPLAIVRQSDQQALERDALLEAQSRDAGAKRLVPKTLEDMRPEASRRPIACWLWHWTAPPRSVGGCPDGIGWSGERRRPGECRDRPIHARAPHAPPCGPESGLCVVPQERVRDPVTAGIAPIEVPALPEGQPFEARKIGLLGRTRHSRHDRCNSLIGIVAATPISRSTHSVARCPAVRSQMARTPRASATLARVAHQGRVVWDGRPAGGRSSRWAAVRGSGSAV